MFGFSFNTDINNYMIQVKLGNEILKTQTISAPDIIVQQNFIELCKQVKQDPRPLKIKIFYYDEIFDEYDKSTKKIENSIEYPNQAYLNSFPNEFKNEGED